MKVKQPYLEDGLVGNPVGVDREAEGYKKLRQAIIENYNTLSDQEKLSIELDGIKYSIMDYLDSEAAHIVPPGSFIKKCLEVSNVTQKTFASYINWDTGNLTKLLNGSRKINADIALILEETFPVSAITWMKLEDKNELTRVKNLKSRDYRNYSLARLQQKV
jgi:plasmid maintenance system antidote protein VapI